jgi:hypothetical protein
MTRNFFAATAGQNPNGSLTINSFTFQTEDGEHPSYKKCIEESEKRYPNIRRLSILSISELSKEDFTQFVSEQ